MSFVKDSEELNQTDKKWVIVQLTPAGEKEKDLSVFSRSVQRYLRKPLEVFVPAVSQKVRQESRTTFYMDGYIFVLYEPGVNYLKLQDTPLFSCVLRAPVRKQVVYHLLDDEKLNGMRAGMNAMRVHKLNMDDQVQVMHGVYKKLNGTISYISDDGEHAQVYINLRSKKLLIDFPSSYLKKIDGA